MEMRASSSSSKRPFQHEEEDSDEDSRKPQMEKKVRFPKGKKARKGDERSAFGGGNEAFGSWMDPDRAARERAKLRSRKREEELFGEQKGDFQEIISRSEVRYEEDAGFEDDGIKIEPFNLEQEREEGYFDEDGNFVEYVNNEIKDAWLDSVDVEPRFVDQSYEKTVKEEGDDYQDLSSEDIGKIKRSIANVLKPGETVIQALKRLKGISNGKKEKMPEDTKRLFDQLTEDAMKLMENGEYNVYQAKRETFDREAEGYERVARARGGTSNSDDDLTTGKDVVSEEAQRKGYPSVLDMALGPSETSTSAGISSGGSGAEFDIFGDEDENNVNHPDSDVNGLGSNSASQMFPPSATESSEPSLNVDQENDAAGTDNDYVYDSVSGYYYSSSSGYYYDSGSGLYCSATSGKWYAYNEQTGSYDEVQDTAPAATASVESI